MGIGAGVMGLLGLSLGAAGLATQTYAAYQQAQADNLAAQWNAAMMENNAKLKDVMAEQELQRGEHEAALSNIKGKQLIEQQRASYAASGVKVDTGSALDVIAEQAGWNKYDESMIKYNASLAAWGHRVEGENLRQQAQMTRSTQRSPWMAATSTLLSGGTSLYNQYNQYQMYRS